MPQNSPGPKARKPPPTSLRARALRLLARREHSRRELERKLAVHAEDPAEVARVLDELEARGWLSERRVVEQLVHARRSRFGARRIERDLLDKGISADAVAAALPGLRESELEAARAVWAKKFGRLARTPAERARQARFLQGRGFAFDVVMKVIKGRDEG
ncbi:MAG: recombination regulator RecX [Betaproteobacteria bacterium]|nr:recombination regulator RecX [Betaproteobacteria bacterium]